MATSPIDTPTVQKILVATDRSQTADRAVRWAATLAGAHNAELLLLQVLTEPADNGDQNGALRLRVETSTADLAAFSQQLAGPRGRARVVVDDDPAQAVIDAAVEEAVDVVVVGNVGMAGRKRFLLGNIPNRISHGAPCTVVIVNTSSPDIGTAASNGRRATGTDGPLEGALLTRAWRIGRVAVKTGARELLERPRAAGADATQVAAQRLRGMLDELGPTFAKLGQILSTRPDLLPPAFLDELATLQERVTPLTEAEVVRVMEQELGVPWEDVFASIDPAPLAAGTIAQVHRATLETGERVVVKVQRPNAEADILQDLGLLELFAGKAAERPAFREVFDVPAMIEHLSSSLRRELDFGREAANLQRMQAVLEPFPRLAVPAVYTEFSTRRLLVMQEVQGVPVREAPPSSARKEAARQLLEAYYHQVLTEGFFHADPHPGNLKWWNDTVYFLDLGMVGEVGPEERRLILLLLLAFSQKDSAFLSEVVLLLAGSEGRTGDIDVEAFRADLDGLINRYRDLSLEEIQLGPMLQEVAQISVRNHVRVPAALMLTGKAFAQMQLVTAELDPGLDPFSVAESYVLRNTLRQVLGSLNPQALFYEAQKTRLRLTGALGAVEGLASGRSAATVTVDTSGTERIEAAITRAGRRLSLALGLGGLLVGAGLAAGRVHRD